MSSELEYTGERFIPGRNGPGIHLEHLHRYHVAASLVRGRVLDLGCGAGYGTQILARRASLAVGLDTSVAAVDYARRRFGEPNARYVVADARDLPIDPLGFDFIVCFETIEHVPDPEGVIAEVRRILAPSGVLLISTPNRRFRGPRNAENPFHCREFDFDEFSRILRAEFDSVVFFGQRLVAGSRIWSLEESGPRRDIHLHAKASAVPSEYLADDDPTYFIGVCHSPGARFAERLAGERVIESLLPGKLEAFWAQKAVAEMESAQGQGAGVSTAARNAKEASATGGAERDPDWGPNAGAGPAPELPNLSALERRLTEVEAALDEVGSERTRLRQELDSIHGSRMWRLWMSYLGLRKFLLAPARLLGSGRIHSVVGALRSAARRIADRTLGLLWLAPQGVGGLYLSGSVLRAQVRALGSRRRGAAEAELPVSVPVSAPSEEGSRPRVLFVVPYSIYPLDHGGAVRIFNIIKRLASTAEIHLFLFVRSPDEEMQRQTLSRYCESIYFYSWEPVLRRDFWGLRPRSAALFSSEDVTWRLRDIVHSKKIDIVHLEYTELAQYLPAVKPAKVVLSEIDITFLSRARRRKSGIHRKFGADRVFGSTWIDWMRQLRYEVKAADGVDQVHVMSGVDGAHLAAYLHDGVARVRVVPNAVDTSYFRPPDEGKENRNDLLFVGNFRHLPNAQALDYFTMRVWPLIRERPPGIGLTVAGSHAVEEAGRLAGSPGITVESDVLDIRSYYQGHRVLVAPILSGSGTRLKILEAMACGLPVVSTTIGAEGIEYREGRDLLIADTAEDFASAVARVLSDDRLARELAVAGRRLIERLYDWDFVVERLRHHHYELLGRRQRGEENVIWPGGDIKRSDPTLPGTASTPVDVSVIIPTYNGGELLGHCLEAIFSQRTDRSFEVICVDSDSNQETVDIIQRYPVRLITIDKRTFNHGLTRDLGAKHALGRVLVFINQDAVPCDAHWLHRITDPLIGEGRYSAIQGGIRENPKEEDRFYWDSCGERFYFTRESTGWISRYGGIGFATGNAALRKEVWERFPFGWAPIMEDKKWQREVTAAGHQIGHCEDAAVFHTHNYNLRTLARRCISEGFGWRFLGETYGLRDALKDMAQPRLYADLLGGISRLRIRSSAELFFPVLRPLFLYHGNRWARDVKL